MDTRWLALESTSLSRLERRTKMSEEKKVTEEVEGQELDMNVEPTEKDIKAAEKIYGKAVE